MSQFLEVPMSEFADPKKAEPLPRSSRPEDREPSPHQTKELSRQVGPHFERFRSGRKPTYRYRLSWNPELPDAAGATYGINSNGERIARSVEDLKRIVQRTVCQYGYGRTLNWDGSSYRPGVWEDHEKDIAELSLYLPGWSFELDILAAEGETVQARKAFRDGRVFDASPDGEDGILKWSPPRSPQPWEPEVVAV